MNVFESIEDKDPQSMNKGLKEFWKIKVMETLLTIYGEDGVNLDKISLFLDEVISRSHVVKADVRNLYERREWVIDIDSILKMVNDCKLIIGANGSYTFRHDVKFSEISELLILWMKQRSEMKAIAITAESEGNTPMYVKYENFQNSKKEYTNSAYGVSVMNGYILSSPDSASMITTQGRELISEMLWSLEKLLGSNLTFKTVNEFYSYVNEVTRLELSDEFIKLYNIKVPTKDMIVSRLRQYIESIPANEIITFDNRKSLFLMVKNILKDDKKCINFYYRYNMYEFLKHNKSIMDKFNWIMEQKKEFTSPFLSVMKKGESQIYIEPLQELTKIFIHFVVVPIPTYDRVDKYINRGRKIVIASDTDSVMPRFDEWLEFMNDNGTVKFDTFYDSDDIYRAVNAMSYICTDILNFMGHNMARNCYVPKEYRHYINIKNEFLFKSMIVYPNIKKNYSVWKVLREGKVINKVDNTGLALTGSNINPYISEEFDKLIFEEIHSKKDVSITSIMKRIYGIEAEIKHRLVNNKDTSFGVFTSYKNSMRANDGNIWADSRIRGVEAWNMIYQDEKIEPFNKIYMFNTSVESEDDLYKIKDPDMRLVAKTNIFNNPKCKEIQKYGLRTIAVPDNMEAIPEWLVDIIDVNKLIEGHVKSITSLLPSIGVYATRMSSTRNHLSPLIRL